jgi:hypothetical protein
MAHGGGWGGVGSTAMAARHPIASIWGAGRRAGRCLRPESPPCLTWKAGRRCLALPP